jgi:hypothetical protein
MTKSLSDVKVDPIIFVGNEASLNSFDLGLVSIKKTTESHRLCHKPLR